MTPDVGDRTVTIRPFDLHVETTSDALATAHVERITSHADGRLEAVIRVTWFPVPPENLKRRRAKKESR